MLALVAIPFYSLYYSTFLLSPLFDVPKAGEGVLVWLYALLPSGDFFVNRLVIYWPFPPSTTSWFLEGINGQGVQSV